MQNTLMKASESMMQNLEEIRAMEQNVHDNQGELDEVSLYF